MSPRGALRCSDRGAGLFSMGRGFLSTPGLSRRQGLLFRGVSYRRATPDPGARHEERSEIRGGATLATGVDRRGLGVQMVGGEVGHSCSRGKFLC